MFGFIEAYWQWRKRNEDNSEGQKFKTPHGQVVHRFSNKYAVVSYRRVNNKRYEYFGFNSGTTWNTTENGFSSRCLRSKRAIEQNYGTLTPITEEEEAKYVRLC